MPDYLIKQISAVEKSLELRPYETLLDVLDVKFGDFEKSKYQTSYGMVKLLKSLIHSGSLNNDQIQDILKRFSEIIEDANSLSSGDLDVAERNGTTEVYKNKIFMGYLEDVVKDSIHQYIKLIKASPNFIKYQCQILKDETSPSDFSKRILVDGENYYKIMALYFVRPESEQEAYEFCAVKREYPSPRVKSA